VGVGVGEENEELFVINGRNRSTAVSLLTAKVRAAVVMLPYGESLTFTVI
jgi:hypothetical protein